MQSLERQKSTKEQDQINWDKWYKNEHKCKFCDTKRFLNPEVSLCKFICTNCDGYICSGCRSNYRFIDSNTFSGCIDCLVKKAFYLDCIADKLAEKLTFKKILKTLLCDIKET